jgi:serine protease
MHHSEEVVPGAADEEARRMLQGLERVIVGFKNKEGENAARARASAVHLAIGGQDAIAMDMPVTAIPGLQNNPNIVYIEKDEILHASAQSTPYGITAVQADPFSLPPLTANGKKVCIIDSGYDLGHPDLPSTGVTGFNSLSGTAWDTDTCGHGK